MFSDVTMELGEQKTEPTMNFFDEFCTFSALPYHVRHYS